MLFGLKFWTPVLVFLIVEFEKNTNNRKDKKETQIIQLHQVDSDKSTPKKKNLESNPIQKLMSPTRRSQK